MYGKTVEILTRKVVAGKGGYAYRVTGLVDGVFCSIDVDRPTIDDLDEAAATAKLHRQLIGCANYLKERERA
jgi:hypothetical protein